MKNAANTLDAPEQGLPTDLVPDPLPAPGADLPPVEEPPPANEAGLQDASVSGGPTPFPPNTPIVGTNGGKAGQLVVWIAPNIVGNAADSKDSQGFASVTLDSPVGSVLTLSNNGVPKVIISGKGNGYIQSGAAANLVLATTIDAQIIFQNPSSVWFIAASNQNNGFAPSVDNGAPLGLTSAAGNSVNSPSYVSGYSFRPVSTKTTVNGSTSGSIIACTPFQGSSGKKIIIQVQNLTGTATYNFPQGWLFTPGVFAQTAALIAAVTTITTSLVTVTGSGTSGVIVLEGF